VRRLALIGLLLALAATLAPAGARAHPLGNFTINRYSEVEVSGDRVYVLYVLDLAEIPTFQARGDVAARGRAWYGKALASRIGRGLRLHVNGRFLGLRELRHELAFPPGQAGLRTTRLEAVFASAPSALLRPGRPGSLSFRDTNFSGRLGWKEIVVQASSGARVLRSSAPSRSISRQLLTYPNNLLESPLAVTSASARIVPGKGLGIPPTLLPAKVLEQRATVRAVQDGGFAALIGRGDLTVLVILASLAAALFWGAAHALSPGHGKTIVAAYLVGQRGTPAHAALLGAIVTVTHTIGVFALGLVTLALSQFIVPEDLYPWLNLVSGVLVVGIGASVFWSRLRRRLAHARAHARGLDHDHVEGRGHPHDHHHEHHHGDGHGHSHVPEKPGLRGLIAVGVSGGLLPCPSALVVLLAAISLHRVAFGLLLIVAFSLGLALTITAIGLVAVYAKRAFSRLSFQGRVVGLLPAASALVILVAGVLMTLRALPEVG
jgi:nickel/cobalt transporter (NicO) family protein